MKTGWCQDLSTEKDVEEFLGWCQGQVSGVGHIQGYGTESKKAF